MKYNELIDYDGDHFMFHQIKLPSNTIMLRQLTETFHDPKKESEFLRSLRDSENRIALHSRVQAHFGSEFVLPRYRGNLDVNVQTCIDDESARYASLFGEIGIPEGEVRHFILKLREDVTNWVQQKENAWANRSGKFDNPNGRESVQANNSRHGPARGSYGL